MTDAGWPGDDTAETQLMALSPAERQVLAALAIVGHASLSDDELAALLEVEDVAPLLDDLERRSLIRREENKRYATLGGVGEEIRKTDAALATGDRLLKYMTTLAKGGNLTAERLVEDAEAILGLSEWAAEVKQWAALLDLVKTLQACFGIAHRIQEWLGLLERGRRAAQALGDRRSEVWVLQQLATASASVGEAAAAQQYLHEADQLQRGRRPRALRQPGTDKAVSVGRQAVIAGDGGGSRLALWIVGLMLAAGAGAGVGAGYAIGNDNGSVGLTTARVPVTVTVRGRTVRTSDRVTLSATTVVTTMTELTTTTETTTVTTTTTVTVGPG